MNNIDINHILRKFNISTESSTYGNGHINDTYLSNTQKHIIQKINSKVFTNPEKLMDNIEKVTRHLREKIIKEGGDPTRQTINLLKTDEGKSYYKLDDDNYFRAYAYIGDAVTIESGETAEQLYSAGKCFGHFHKLLADFPADKLYEVIKDFHHTPKRVEALKKAIDEDKCGRAKLIRDEIEFALECADFASVVVDGIADGSLKQRVTHNDTKINNVLFDLKTNEAICVIDLDTVMMGSVLYDFGDALRLGASTAKEDETDLLKVSFDEEKFESFARGFFSEMKDSLSEREIELLPFSAKLLTYECGIRFLTDYLNGDTYFKTSYNQHNLDRARNQFKLVQDIANKEEKLKEIIKKISDEI